MKKNKKTKKRKIMHVLAIKDELGLEEDDEGEEESHIGDCC